ncbi:MAG: ABC transporter permease [Proteobacteria bacterium]|nr:ABC transporter permease [Pseudomonadota bacterium]
MNLWVSFKTILAKEIWRIFRVWTQTLLPSGITMGLYFVIFGNLLGSRLGTIEGTPYILFITPGLIMMAVIMNSYANVVSSLYISRFQRSIEEILVSTTSNMVFMLGFVVGGMIRGLLVGIVVTIIALFFTHLELKHTFVLLLVLTLSAFFFSLAGFANALVARDFDDTMIIPTFLITPLTYLGGVFYSITFLPDIWQKVSLFNPILYIVNGFRYGMLGVSDIQISIALLIMTLACGLMCLLNLYLLKKGTGLRQ